MKFRIKKLNSQGISHFILPAVVVLVVGAVGVHVLTRSHAATFENGLTSGSVPGAPDCHTYTPPTLSLGSSGCPVVVLQVALNNWIDLYNFLQHKAVFHDLVVDGQFGPATQYDVKLYQGFKHLPADGVVGQQTWYTMSQDCSVFKDCFSK